MSPIATALPAEQLTELAGERQIWFPSIPANSSVFDHLQLGCSCFDQKQAFLDHALRIKKPETSILPLSELGLRH